ncbi:hypothetical protein QUF88_01095 [Bacillus sp. DX1.1]|uniref:hypothetical protein n=1 Tax=Bacillus sp. DX1.1 TaxID=3055866 RepID=UPI0025A08D71|nr:hypothetical protein [Bacillus sp. DX1.1]MDM5152609.1 hypothetical protein [Bacillus sp. DX1.1]
MRKLTGIILSLFLLCSTFAPSLAFAAEKFDSNKIGWVQEGNEKYYFDKPGVKHTGWLELEGKTITLIVVENHSFLIKSLMGKHIIWMIQEQQELAGWIQ